MPYDYAAISEQTAEIFRALARDVPLSRVEVGRDGASMKLRLPCGCAWSPGIDEAARLAAARGGSATVFGGTLEISLPIENFIL